jgi:hypothetical protein
MRRSLATAVAALGLVALIWAAPAAAGLPKAGALLPGRSLGGVRLGETPQAVRTVLGHFYGICRGCSRPTWYFTYRAFKEQGLAVEFERGRVSGVYTLWRPVGWHAPHGLRFGATPLTVHDRVGTLHTITCRSYVALVRDSVHARTAYYLFEGRLWGFGLFRPDATPCR